MFFFYTVFVRYTFELMASYDIDNDDNNNNASQCHSGSGGTVRRTQRRVKPSDQNMKFELNMK